MCPVTWRWEEKDYGFRFIDESGKELYQGMNLNEFYEIPKTNRILSQSEIARLNSLGFMQPPNMRIVENPWYNYGPFRIENIDTQNGICINYAGCLDQNEISRIENEGWERAFSYVKENANAFTSLSKNDICKINATLLGDIYPFAGKTRTIPIQKKDGDHDFCPPPMIFSQIEGLCNGFLEPIKNYSNEKDLFFDVATVICGLNAIHPFREGNGRTALLVGSIVLIKHGKPPLEYGLRKRDEADYYKAIFKYFDSKQDGIKLLADLIEKWARELQ